MFIHFWEGEIGRGTEDPKQPLRWQQWAQCGAQTHELWDQDLSWSQMLNWIGHPGSPIYFERARAWAHGSMRAGEGQREGERESQAGSTLSAEPEARLNPMTDCEIMTWAEIKSQILNRLSHPGAPIRFLLSVWDDVFLFCLASTEIILDLYSVPYSTCGHVCSVLYCSDWFISTVLVLLGSQSVSIALQSFHLLCWFIILSLSFCFIGFLFLLKHL